MGAALSALFAHPMTNLSEIHNIFRPKYAVFFGLPSIISLHLGYALHVSQNLRMPLPAMVENVATTMTTNGTAIAHYLQWVKLDKNVIIHTRSCSG